MVLCGTWSETSIAPSQLTQFWQFPRQNAFLFTVHAIFRHDYPLAVEPASTQRPLVQKKTLRDSLPIDMLLSALSFLVVAQSSSEVPEGLMNNPVYQWSEVTQHWSTETTESHTESWTLFHSVFSIQRVSFSSPYLVKLNILWEAKIKGNTTTYGTCISATCCHCCDENL